MTVIAKSCLVQWDLELISNGNFLLRNQRYHNHASYNSTDTADDKANVLSIRTGKPREWHIKLIETYYVCVGLQHVLHCF